MTTLIFNEPTLFLLWIAAVVIALSIHEFSHAVVAHALGDRTADRAGRLTLNPMAHIDPLGFIMLMFVGFGWGKPVPFNPHNLRFPRWGPALVAMAGPGSNLLSVLIVGAMLRIFQTGGLAPQNLLVIFLSLVVMISAALFVFNLIPIPPLDGSKFLFSILSAPKYDQFRFLLESRGPIILLAFIIIDRFLPFSIFGFLFRMVFSLLERAFGAVLSTAV